MLPARRTAVLLAAMAAQALAADRSSAGFRAAWADAGTPDDTLAPLVDEPTPPPPSSRSALPPSAVPASPFTPEGIAVTSSTRTPQAAELAPSVVTVLTREELLALGYRSLTEVLRNTAGFEVNDDGAWPDLGARGLNDTGSHGSL